MWNRSIVIGTMALATGLSTLGGCNKEDGHDHGTPAPAQAASAPAPAAPKTASEFVQHAGSGLLLFVTASEMAQKAIAHEADKKFAAEMQKEYTTLLGELETLAKAKNAKLPEEPRGEHRKLLDAMMQLKGEGFESAFHKVLGSEHTTMAAYFQSADASLPDAETKAFIAKALPLLREHAKELGKHDHSHSGHKH